ncbi:zinc finger protein 813-like [Branchiostoma floridae]|uniref:Zinc finger protein 813-like n=1 Tax=Branchiostoma floridae TaxID=7739 RepID=A0A9J7HPB8_BRAFL|nr:zinc finger protein 813-like [Branchiostoma floridae]
MSRQQEFICGLSHEVTISVLPRLNMEELMFELNRRIQNLDKKNSIKDRLVSILRDVMLEEYRLLERTSEVSSPEEKTVTIAVQNQETAIMQENVLTACAETMVSETSSFDASQLSDGAGRHCHDEFNIDTPTCSTQVQDTLTLMNTSYSEKHAESNTPCEEAPSASRHLPPDHGDVHIKMERHVSEDDQIWIGQVSQPYTDQTKYYADGRETSFIKEHSRKESSGETPLAPCEPTPYGDCESTESLLTDSSSRIDLCGFNTTRACSLSQHRKFDKQENPLICSECGYRAHNKNRLVEHMRTHTGEKPFKCNHCNYKTSYKQELFYHMKTHTDAEPYRCKICDYQTHRKSNFETHMMRHSGVKPYKCKECDYRTAHKGDLIKHKRRHTGERPYSCQECDYKATVKCNLVQHMRSKHQ